MCNCGFIAVSRDFMYFMRQCAGDDETREHIDEMIDSHPPEFVFGAVPSCTVQGWLFTTSAAVWELKGIHPHKLIRQDEEGKLLVTREGHDLLADMIAEEGNQPKRSQFRCHPAAS